MFLVTLPVPENHSSLPAVNDNRRPTVLVMDPSVQDELDHGYRLRNGIHRPAGEPKMSDLTHQVVLQNTILLCTIIDKLFCKNIYKTCDLSRGIVSVKVGLIKLNTSIL